MSRAAASAVPRFGSFKPKKAVDHDEERHEETRRQIDSITPRDASRYGEVESRRHTEARSRQRRHRDERHDRDHSQPTRAEAAVPHRETHTVSDARDFPRAEGDSADSSFFIVDRQGDAKNVEFGSLHRYGIPSHHRIGYGRVLGAPSTATIDRAESSDRHTVLRDGPHGSRNTPGRLLGSARSQSSGKKKLRFIAPTSGAVELAIDADFVSLGSRTHRKRKRDAESPAGAKQSWEEADLDYIEGDRKRESDPSDEDVDVAMTSDEEAGDSQFARAVRDNHGTLLRRIKDHPDDVRAWTTLIEHQAQVAFPGTDPAQLTNSEKHSLADIRLTIYEQAIRHIGKDRLGHAELVLGRLGQGSLLWESTKLTERWTTVLKEHPGEVTIFVAYLDFVQTSHIDFRYERCRDAYLECLEVLHEARTASSEGKHSDVARSQLYVLSRFTTFVRDAGYDELAYAVWQALLEYHFFAPPNTGDLRAKMESSEGFWESEVPRVGEEDALGWAHYAHDQGKKTRRVPFASFADGETGLLTELHLSADTTSDSEVDDPFRYVMFSDLRPCIEPLLANFGKRELLNSLLSFLRRPQMPTLDPSPRRWQTDQFLSAGSRASYSDSRMPTSLDLFRDAFDGCCSVVSQPAVAVFADRTLQQLVFDQPDDEVLAEYYLAHKLALYPNEVVKAAKRLLKIRPTSLRLYNAYALVEVKLERSKKAADVWATALEMGRSLPDEEQLSTVRLWHSWIFTLAYHGDSDAEPLQRMLAMCRARADGTEDELCYTEVSAPQRLRLAQHCESGWERMIHARRWDLAILFAECHILFAYLADGRALASIIELRQQYSARLSRSGPPEADESLLQTQADLLRLHIDLRRPYKPSFLRAELADNIRRFPNNSSLLWLYLQIRPETHIDNHLRASLQDDLLTGPNAALVGWSFAIDQEPDRHSPRNRGSTEASVRDVFRRALLAPDSSVRHSVPLWEQWFDFEHPSQRRTLLSDHPLSDAQRQQALQRARQVFLDGLRLLPWSKRWVLKGLEAFGRSVAMTAGELRRVYDVLGERELRVRMPVEQMEEAIAEPDP
ncbi:hypothetical protein LTR53_007386 [Teratosphaeriaceae sp. CCFEE 6253]|nr:hypothetical protein LTR53_007386 [Teratosphaeriaceae sp. CCFEE 6253]